MSCCFCLVAVAEFLELAALFFAAVLLLLLFAAVLLLLFVVVLPLVFLDVVAVELLVELALDFCWTEVLWLVVFDVCVLFVFCAQRQKEAKVIKAMQRIFFMAVVNCVTR